MCSHDFMPKQTAVPCSAKHLNCQLQNMYYDASHVSTTRARSGAKQGLALGSPPAWASPSPWALDEQESKRQKHKCWRRRSYWDLKQLGTAAPHFGQQNPQSTAYLACFFLEAQRLFGLVA